MWRARVALALVAIVPVALGAGIAAARNHGPAKLSELGRPTLADCQGLGEASGEVDAVIAIDTSKSTVEATGVDVDQDGRLGRQPSGRRLSEILAGSTDPGDSLLAAQVSASLSLARGLEQPGLRLGIVAYSGVANRRLDRRLGSSIMRNEGGYRTRDSATQPTSDARVDAPPTTDRAALETALEGILSRGSAGNTNFTAGMRAAQGALSDASARTGELRRIVLIMSDSGTPRIVRDGSIRKDDPEVAEAIRGAAEAGVVFHTFGLGFSPSQEPEVLGEIAKGTGGRFHPVGDLSSLHCALAAALLPGETQEECR